MRKDMHAPGPWSARNEQDDGGKYAIQAANGIQVALTIGNTSTETANAHLIAAAPELLDALQWLIKLEESDGAADALAKARAAIAKATGATA